MLKKDAPAAAHKESKAKGEEIKNAPQQTDSNIEALPSSKISMTANPMFTKKAYDAS